MTVVSMDKIAAIVLLLIIAYIFIHVAIVLTKRAKINEGEDRKLKVNTVGLREWEGKDKKKYHRAESTPYTSLQALVNSGRLKETGDFVDFGSGKGRFTLFMADYFDKQNKETKFTGVELNDNTFSESLENLGNTKLSNVCFTKEDATKYSFRERDSIYFFFNPFNGVIFEEVINNIKEDAVKNKKQVEVILYYQTYSYKKVMRKHKEFVVKAKVYPDFFSRAFYREYFTIYQFDGSVTLD